MRKSLAESLAEALDKKEPKPKEVKKKLPPEKDPKNPFYVRP